MSTDEQDVIAQREALAALMSGPQQVDVDYGADWHKSGAPGARAACRTGDTLVVTKLDRLTRSLPDARAIARDLTARQVRLDPGGSVPDPADPADPVGRLLFNVPATVAEFEADPARRRARGG